MGVPVSEREQERLAALRSLRILDTPPEPEYDNLARLASLACRTPTALITLIDADRQWFKARVGFDLQETPRDIAFCAHTILHPGILEVSDASKDERFAGNPLVTSDRHIRFYAGVPLIAGNGFALGTLCVLDHLPRSLSGEQKEMLQALGLQASNLLEMRRSIEDRFHSLFVNSIDAILLATREGVIEAANPEACRMFGYTEEELRRIGRRGVVDTTDPRLARLLQERDTTGRFKGELTFIRKDGSKFPGEVSSIFYKDKAGALKAGVIIRDVTERVRAETALRAIAEGTAAQTGENFFQSLVQHLSVALNVKWCYVTECTDASRTAIRTLAFWKEGNLTENISWALEGTPCEGVIAGKISFYACDLPRLFPRSAGLGVDSYLGVPLSDSSGNILGHLAVLDDRPMQEDPSRTSILKIFAARAGMELERQRNDKALRSSEERFRTLFESAPIAVTLNNSDGKFLQVNPRFSEMLGYTEEEICRMTFKEITFHEDLPESKKVFGELVKGLRKEFRVEKRYHKKDGDLMWANTICSAVPDSEGRFLYTFAMIEDISERKRSEQALREALAEVEVLKNRLQAENIYLQEEIKTEYNFEEIVGISSAIRKVFAGIQRVGPTDSTVLITGETGTGKELVARAIHNLSGRKNSALIKVNCAALPTGLIESELFGHEKGAFTGAISRKKGRFELADGGSIFLDEIGELPLETQTKLLRVLQEYEFERVGSSQTSRVDVRVISATNRNLEDLVKSGAFRADLFYRLNIFPIHLPPLRDRREDIPILAGYFAGKFARRMGKKIDRVDPEVMRTLENYDWPGNIRELANLLERAVILCDEAVLRKEHVSISAVTGPRLEATQTLEETERRSILKTLEQTGWVVGGSAGAARILGLNRTTLLARMKKLGIRRPETSK